MPELQLPGAPGVISAALERLKEALTQAAGSNLAGLVLYGGLARGRYRPGKSDVNILVLLHDASASALATIAPALQAAWRAAAVEPMLLTPAELPRAANAFPIKFLDIKQHHVVLAGADPFPNLDVPRDLVRLRIEQELRNLLLRLRHQYIAAGNDSVVLAHVLARAAKPFAIELAALLQLAGRPAPADDRTDAVFDAAAAAFELDREPLAQLAKLRHDARPGGDVPALFRSVLDALTSATEIADRMKESPA